MELLAVDRRDIGFGLGVLRLVDVVVVGTGVEVIATGESAKDSSRPPI